MSETPSTAVIAEKVTRLEEWARDHDVKEERRLGALETGQQELGLRFANLTGRLSVIAALSVALIPILSAIAVNFANAYFGHK